MVDCGTVTVEETTSSADVYISDCSVSPSNVTVDDTVYVDFTVQNDSSTQATADVEGTANGVPIGSISVTVSGNASESDSFTFTPSDVGASRGNTFSVSVDKVGTTFSAVVSKAASAGRSATDRVRNRL